MIRKSLLFFFLLSLAIRVLTALPQQHPGNMDEAYHTVNAITLASGGGFVEDFIWNYLNPPETVTHPGNLYWMPLTGIIAAAGMMPGGISWSAGQWGFILLSALLPPLGYLIAWQVSAKKRHARSAALLMLFSGFYFPVWTVIDTFTPFALAGALSLYAAWRALETGHYRWAILAGVMTGLAHLTRADGALLFLVICFWFPVSSFEFRVPGSRFRVSGLSRNQQTKTKNPKPKTRNYLFFILAYLLTMLPWLIRNLNVIGTPLPSGGSKTIWLQSYADIFSYNKDLSLQSYLAWGWGNILQSKLWAISINLQTLIAVIGLIVIFPLALIGWWKLRRHPLFQLSGLYLLLLWLAMTLVFTFPGPRGALFHSGGAVLPFVFTAAMIGLDAAIVWIARRRSSWRVGSAQKVFGGGLILFALLISFFAYARQLTAEDPLAAAYAQTAQQYPAETLMLGDPPLYLYSGGYKAIIIPTEEIDVALQAAERYDASYLALDKNFASHPLGPFLSEQAVHPRLKLESVFDETVYLYKIMQSSK
ncbi:MAG TPA: glycosyltransferase family 39 protein [Chloroflexi bacterium]|nr:glycosyltransferase family 39 protein [Chloroflexota bacterium]